MDSPLAEMPSLLSSASQGGRWMIIQGQDTLMHPSRPLLTQELDERCKRYMAKDPGRPRVLIQVAPKRTTDGWQIMVYIVGDDGGENWEFLFSDAYDLTRARLAFAYRH